VVVVLLLDSTRVVLPHGQTLTDLQDGQPVQVTGTVNWRTHSVLRPVSFVVQQANSTTPCTSLPATGGRTCAGA
jgi:hypothetical protein